ncbi:type VII secretion protein EccB [Nonomuraea sp. LPB2021202275-12-8]|uniref:type VII secretion protein EccB n=1 Tax=Nonomuraea sp. LPB2021202275-12-8 TaxID=3120159 RepID=UPI00300D53D2
MQTRKDLYQAHRLMQQRLGMALLQAEPDVAESPMRRHNVATFSGVLIGVLVAAAFGIWGLLKPGGATNLTEAGQVLVEEETGAKYVYSQEMGKMLPVANYASARLLLDAGEVTTRNVSAASLDDYARGPLVGIVGAPDSLPAKDMLVKGPWSVCVVEAPNAAGTWVPYVSLVGGSDVGGTPVGDGALVVTDGQQPWVIWNDQRMKVDATGVRALNAQPRAVPSSWINAIPPGPDLIAPEVPERGKRVRGPDGRAAAIGQIFSVQEMAGAPARSYVLLRDGLASINTTQTRLLLEDSRSKAAYGNARVVPKPIDAATANARLSKRNLAVPGMPTSLPKAITTSPSAPLCSVYADTQKGSTRAKLTVGGTMRIQVPAVRGDQEHFDQVLMPPGRAAMAGLLPGDGQLGSVHTYYLISDQGKQHELQSADLLGKLGYDAEDVAPVPGNLIHLIPVGPKLDPAAARQPVTTGG